MTKPITPDQANKIREQSIPDYVFVAFNELIAKNPSKVLQDDVIERIIHLSSWNVSRGQIFENRWLDIEHIYQQYGWDVKYDKPAYNETYKAYFVFTPK